MSKTFVGFVGTPLLCFLDCLFQSNINMVGVYLRNPRNGQPDPFNTGNKKITSPKTPYTICFYMSKALPCCQVY